MGKITKSELDQLKSRILKKLGPDSGNKVQITDLNAVKLYGFNNVYVTQYITRKV